MKEYGGKSADLYTQHPAKLIILFPAINDSLPAANSNGATLLDLACGNGDLQPVAVKKGYKYFGLDSSQELLARAKKDYPNGTYIQADSKSFSNNVSIKFDVIIISMLFATFKKKSEITQTLRECKKMIKAGGKIIIGDAHPTYDPYMQVGLLGRKDVITKFNGYFDSGKLFRVPKEVKGGVFVFNDYHHTLTDYFECIKDAGLFISNISECKASEEYKHIDPDYYERKKNYPTFIIFICCVK